MNVAFWTLENPLRLVLLYADGVMWASYTPSTNGSHGARSREHGVRHLMSRVFYERKPRCTEHGIRRLVNRGFSIDILDTSLRLQSASFIHSPMTFKRLEASSVTNQRRLTSGGAGSTEASHHESWVAECTGGEPAASSSSRSDHP